MYQQEKHFTFVLKILHLFLTKHLSFSYCLTYLTTISTSICPWNTIFQMNIWNALILCLLEPE